MIHERFRVLAGGVVLLAVLALGACGGDAATADPTVTVAGVAAAAATTETPTPASSVATLTTGTTSAASTAIQTPVPTSQAATAVSNDSDATSSSRTNALCDLLTESDVTDATGAEVISVEPYELSSCTWQVAPEDDFRIVKLVQMTPEDFEEYHASGAIEGVGDEAYWDPSLGGFFFRIADHAFSLQVLIHEDDPEADLAIARSLSLTIIDRL